MLVLLENCSSLKNSLYKIALLAMTLFFLFGTTHLAHSVTSTNTATISELDDEIVSTAIASEDIPLAPIVDSLVFSDTELWYNTFDGVFVWEIPFDVSAVAVEVATSSKHEPLKVFNPPIEEFEVSNDNVSEGIQYLSIQFKNQEEWGSITNRKIQIDTTPPEPFTIYVLTNTAPSPFSILVFEAEDATSGIDHYQLTIPGRETVEVTPHEAKIGYLLTELEDGTYTVKVTAFDKAGNETVATAPVPITAGWLPVSSIVEESTTWMYFTKVNFLLVFLLVIVFAEFGYIFHARNQFTLREEKLRKETQEIENQMVKIFSALRDEIYDQIRTITKRPRLSAKEQEAVDGLNQALEVSETLIKQEINSVKL